MYINNIDKLFDDILDTFNKSLNKKKFIIQISDDENFVKYQNDIVEYIKNFIDDISKKELSEIVKINENIILNILKRYCAFYIYFSIAYYYEGDRDLFITNLLETSKNQQNSKYQIENFFNSENNAKIIKLFTVIKNILELQKFKDFDRIKIILENNPVKYNDTINIFNLLGEDFIIEYFFVKDNFHNIIKTFIFKLIYQNEEKDDILNILNEKEIKNAKYKYIEIIISSKTKLLDFPFFQTFLTEEEIRNGRDREYYSYLEENKTEDEFIYNDEEILDFMFSNKLLIPISEDFLRFHKNTEKYDKIFDSNLKDRDSTKIKYVINKLNKVKNIYSKYYEKNPKLKLEALDLYYKQLINREAILYNDNEEVKIIQKLQISEQTTDLDYMVDLKNARNYAYLNYKISSKDSFMLRTTKSVQAVRHVNIKNDIKGKNLELRVGNSNLPINTVGVIFNPSNLYLECFSKKDFVNINNSKSTNGYKNFIKLLNNSYSNNIKKDKLYYWLFDNDNDKVTLEEYRNISSINKNKYIKTIISNLFNTYSTLISNYILNIIKTTKDLDIYKVHKLVNKYSKKYFHFNNLNFKLKNIILSNVLDIIFKEVDISQNELIKEDKIIQLPKSNFIKKNIKYIYLKQDEDEYEKVLKKSKNINSICAHYLKWIELGKISKKDNEKLNQYIFDFVKKYVRVNDQGDYVCKSCNELLNLKKYVYEGTYVAELDTFLTTNLAVNQNLNEIPKYSTLTRTIRMLEKNIEKICQTINLNYYLGNIPVIKLRRKMLIKDVIDLILLHTKYLKENNKERLDNLNKNYNINKDLTNLFFFELKDEIFLTSSEDTDYYKIIKFNNVLTYIIFLIISEINVGQILTLKDNKKCNYFLYDKIGKKIFENLFLRIDENIKILIGNIPLLGYIIFYFSCMLTNNYIWLWNKENISENYNTQKIIIHTIVDLMNSIIEANLSKNKNYIYELIVNRFIHKVKNVYNDKNILKILEADILSKIKIDNVTNKIGYISKKEKLLELSGIFMNKNDLSLYEDHKYCISKLKKINIMPHQTFNNKFTNLTNCKSGNFHNWKYLNNDLICTLCNEKYSTLKKKKYSEIDVINSIKFIYLKKLANHYCLSGNTHNIDASTNICTKCKINIKSKEYTNNELLTLEKNLNKIKNHEFTKDNEKLKNSLKKQENVIKNHNKIINKFKKKYIKDTKNKIINYIDDFISKLVLILGNKIKIDNHHLSLQTTSYTIMNDYLGNKLKNHFSILSSDNLIIFKENHKYFKRSVLYYHDKIKNVYIYYDNITKNYLGYSYDQLEFKKLKSESYIKIKYSLRDILKLLGLPNKFVNIYHINDKYKKKDFNLKYINSENLLKDLIRNRINNLNFIILKTHSIIEKIINKNKNKFTNNEESKIVDEIIKKIKFFNLNNENNSKKVFKYKNIITKINEPKEVNINLEFNNNFINTDILKNLNNNDSLLLYYYIFNLNRLLEYNDNSLIKTDLALMIIKIILYGFNQFYIPYEDGSIREFDFFLLNDTPYISESLKITGYYQDLVNVNEIDDERVAEIEYNTHEEMNSLDVEYNDDDDDFYFEPNED